MKFLFFTLPLVALAKSGCEAGNGMILEDVGSGMHMLQRGLSALREKQRVPNGSGPVRLQGEPTASQGFFDFQKILADDPPGSFLNGMEVLVKAIDLVYNTTEPWYDPDLDKLNTFHAGGRSWQRLRQFDRDPKPGGVFARVFSNPEKSTLVIAFKGICMENDREQCIMDWCYLNKAKAYGNLSQDMASMFGASPATCEKYEGRLEFTQQADALVRQVQQEMPKEIEIILTGHSLGGLMAMVTSAQQPHQLKAMTFAPTPFHVIMQDELQFSDDEIHSLNANNFVATCDVYDCGINSLYVAQARLGAKTCLYKGQEEPPPCQNMAAEPYETPGWRHELGTDPSKGLLTALPNLMCKMGAHDWWRYSKLILRRSEDGSAASVPVCSTDYSVLTVEWAFAKTECCGSFFDESWNSWNSFPSQEIEMLQERTRQKCFGIGIWFSILRFSI